jgi:hypothetical protein
MQPWEGYQWHGGQFEALHHTTQNLVDSPDCAAEAGARGKLFELLPFYAFKRLYTLLTRPKVAKGLEASQQ